MDILGNIVKPQLNKTEQDRIHANIFSGSYLTEDNGREM